MQEVSEYVTDGSAYENIQFLFQMQGVGEYITNTQYCIKNRK